MDKEKWLKDICDECPIDQIIYNCYHSRCDKDKCYNRFITKRYPFGEVFEKMVDDIENRKILKEMLYELEKKK